MKKLFSVAMACLFATAISAQIQKGDIVLMGGGGYSTNKIVDDDGQNSDEFKVNSGFVDFGAMYMLLDPLGVGLALIMNNSATFSGGEKISSQSLTGARVMGRYYSPCMAPRFYTFGQVDLGFAGGSRKQFDSDGNEIESARDNVSQFSAGLRPGIAYFLTPAIMIEASFGALAFTSTTRKNNENNDLKVTNTALDFFAFSKSLQFGFCWWLGRNGQAYN